MISRDEANTISTNNPDANTTAHGFFVKRALQNVLQTARKGQWSCTVRIPPFEPTIPAYDRDTVNDMLVRSFRNAGYSVTVLEPPGRNENRTVSWNAVSRKKKPGFVVSWDSGKANTGNTVDQDHVKEMRQKQRAPPTNVVSVVPGSIANVSMRAITHENHCMSQWPMPASSVGFVNPDRRNRVPRMAAVEHADDDSSGDDSDDSNIYVVGGRTRLN